MNRRAFCRFALALLPAFAGCSTADRRTNGSIQRVGLLEYPLGFTADLSHNPNVFGKGGEDAALARGMDRILRPQFAEFEPQFRAGLASALHGRGIETSFFPCTKAANDPIGRKECADIELSGKEPFYLRCRLRVHFEERSGGIAAGTGAACFLAKPDGQVVWSRNVGVDPGASKNAVLVGTSPLQFKDRKDLVANAATIPAGLMPFARALGRAVGDTLASEAA